jgi:hypothetical protein
MHLQAVPFNMVTADHPAQYSVIIPTYHQIIAASLFHLQHTRVAITSTKAPYPLFSN